MKALIWILTFIIGSILNMILGFAIGIKAGSILLFLVELYIAKKLCEKWDRRKNEKQVSNHGIQNAVAETEPIFATEKEENISLEPKRKIRYCRRCGSKLIAGSRFCSNCGTQIEKEGI